ncbi:MAG: hypothetical protein LBL18_02045 [Bacteroidales bacterium]|jgi:DNA polymerase-3 subunit alpha|nr:hypothetical protein [Bacteroidales bacterium]
MNNIEKLCVYYQDAKKNGINIIPPDVNVSESDFIIDHSNNAIIYSLAAIRGSGDYVVKEMVKERKANGPYESIFDFAERLELLKILNRRFLENFIKSGAFDKLHPCRKQLLDSIELILSIKPSVEQASLFEKTYPKLVDTGECNQTEKLQNEFVAIGFYISSHPVQQYEDVLRQYRLPSLAEAKELSKSRVVVIINGFSYKTTKTQNKFCILQISDASGVADASMFSETLTVCRDLIEVGNIVVMDITCYKNDDQMRITIDKMRKFDATKAFQLSAESATISALKSDDVIQKPVTKILQLKIENKKELLAIKTLIDNFKKNGNCFIELLTPERILLPDRYFITSYDILDLRNIVGIDNVKEAIKQ